MPSATPLPVRLRTSHAAATICIHVPVTEIAWPTKNSRKFLEWPIAWNVRWTLRPTRVMPGRP